MLNGSCEHISAHYEGQPVGTARIRIFEGIGKLGYQTSSDEFIEDEIPHLLRI
ncbi:hypothetical protein [Paenibacillus apis]|uniref:Uncharacterized protein n=1 Tax=Paenibacillus apis TaxID=1792174 RepID=A0A920CLU6_9BACL|nr:hypothetical protein [Paenibacillus apis]GIO43810.1 hypothetical protein J41TS4_35680 [Paenibacillus apis]